MSTLRKIREDGLFTSFSLHILAMALMLCDHMWATLFPLHDWMTCVGRIAFPIFAFMTVEGYHHTRNFGKYIKRLLIFALITEVPFDLMYAGIPFFPFHQNVLWTFLIGLLLIRWLDKIKAKFAGRKYGTLLFIAAAAGVTFLGFLIGTVTMVDYFGAGIVLVLVFYFFYERTPLNCILLFAALYYIFVELLAGRYYPMTIFGYYIELSQEGLGFLALIPIWLYRGRQGYHAKWFQYFCYAFYPAHMLILYLLMMLRA